MPEVWVVGVVAHSAGRGDFRPGQPCRFAFWAREYPAIRSIEGPGDTREADSGPGRNTTEQAGAGVATRNQGAEVVGVHEGGRQSLADIQGA